MWSIETLGEITMHRDPKRSRLVKGNAWAITVIVLLASLLAREVAVECHSTVLAYHAGAPFISSLLYGVAVWWWWGVLACVYWIALRHWPRVSNLSPRMFL